MTGLGEWNAPAEAGRGPLRHNLLTEDGRKYSRPLTGDAEYRDAVEAGDHWIALSRCSNGEKIHITITARRLPYHHADDRSGKKLRDCAHCYQLNSQCK